jgi:hypothetical protein
LPEHSTAGELYQNVGVGVGEVKAAIKRKLHGYEWNAEIGAKYSIIR